jgi:type VI secretion system secreted protein VgrG
VQIPRIGQEVIVDFLEGDPDRPIITGRVYNAEQMPPYELPANQTQSGIKSRSTKGAGADNFNEIRFEDRKGSELLYIHAERDHTTVVENSEVREVGLVKKDPGSQTITIHGDQVLTIKHGDQTETVEKGDQTIILAQGNQTLEIKRGDQSVKLGMGDQTTKLDLGKSTLEAMQAIELKVGQSSIRIDQTGVTIKGMAVKIEGQIQTEVKGLMTKVNGSAMVQVKGGITMIN